MRQIPALDGLRGLAITLVVLRHAAYLGEQVGDLPTAAAVFMLNGWIGVDLFFILSGFLIARPFFSNQVFSWRTYLTRRSLRILPVYIFSLALAFFIPFYDVSNTNMGWRIFYHLLFLQDYLPSDIVIAFWSLGVEEKFYLLAPIVLPFAIKYRRIETQVLILIAILILGPVARFLTVLVSDPASSYPEFFKLYRSPFHACLDGLFFGVLLARLEALRVDWLTPDRARIWFWIGALTLLALMLSHELLDHLGMIAAVLRPVGIGLVMALLVGAAIFNGAPRVLGSAVPRWLGRISYSLYLIHIPLIGLSIELTRPLGGKFFVFLPIYVAISLAMAQLMHMLIERPFLDLKKRLAPSS